MSTGDMGRQVQVQRLLSLLAEDGQEDERREMLVKCLNCGLTWDRITVYDAPPGNITIANSEICYFCPGCRSNAFDVLTKEEVDKLRRK